MMRGGAPTALVLAALALVSGANQRRVHDAALSTPHDVGSYLTAGGHACFDGSLRDAVGSLGLFSASPHAVLYLGSVVKPGESCASRGYTTGAAESACYPGVTQSFRDGGSTQAAASAAAAALSEFASRYKLSDERAAQLAACSCHPMGATRQGLSPASHCTSASLGVGSWVHTDLSYSPPWELLCSSGPWLDAVRSLAVLKTTQLLPLHQSDQVLPMSCADRGFPIFQDYPAVLSPHPEHCYPPMVLYSRNVYVEGDADFAHMVAVEARLLRHGGFRAFADEHGLAHDVFDSGDGCNCLPGSRIATQGVEGVATAKQLAASCAAAGSRSPIRGWWQGYEGDV